MSGLHKKLDVARKLIEDIRATVTEESRRKALIEAVGAFEKKASKEGEGLPYLVRVIQRDIGLTASYLRVSSWIILFQ